jgi:Holliday junction resolvase-like predicted endonuclease
VKARPTADAALIAVTPTQARRIAAAAGQWMVRDPLAARSFCRFDIVAVSSNFRVTHIENAFEGR